MSFGVSGSNPYNYTFTTGSVENAGSAETTGSVQTAGSAQTTGSVKGTVNTIVYEATAARVGASQSASGITYTGSNSVDLVILDAKKALESINCSVGDIGGAIPNIMKELTAGNKYLEEMLAAKIDLLRQEETTRRENVVRQIEENVLEHLKERASYYQGGDGHFNPLTNGAYNALLRGERIEFNFTDLYSNEFPWITSVIGYLDPQPNGYGGYIYRPSVSVQANYV